MSDTAEAKKERAAKVTPEAILKRQKHPKTKKYIYEVNHLRRPRQDHQALEHFGRAQVEPGGQERPQRVGELRAVLANHPEPSHRLRLLGQDLEGLALEQLWPQEQL